VAIGLFVSYNYLPRLFQPITMKAIEEGQCRDSLKSLDVKISGRVLNKYRDKRNHYMRMLEFTSGNATLKTDILMNDGSGAYDFIAPGDSVVKDLRSMQLQVIRDGNLQTFILSFGCNQSQ
jgi:hypothetical protein